MAPQMVHSVNSSTLADVLERVLDKGIIIAGDIKIKLVEIELLTIEIRLMIASVDKAREIGMDWWVRNPSFNSSARGQTQDSEIKRLTTVVERLERRMGPVARGGGRGARGEKQPVARGQRKLPGTAGVPPALTAQAVLRARRKAAKARRALA